MIRRPPRSTHCISSAASDVYKRQDLVHSSSEQRPLKPVTTPGKPKAPKGSIKINMESDGALTFTLPTEESYRAMEEFVTDLKLAVHDTRQPAKVSASHKAGRKSMGGRIDTADSELSDKKLSGEHLKSSSQKNSPNMVKKSADNYFALNKPNTPRSINIRSVKMLNKPADPQKKLFSESDEIALLKKAREDLGVDVADDVRLMPAIRGSSLKLEMAVHDVKFMNTSKSDRGYKFLHSSIS
eukprot:TRINITY_DN11608_c0_g1_i3.p1 TRINITY_DN11608_c0_g1~~TRINITY_DN11608_c0_g1_i3.p1  ORF type:complete len:250 (-),score=44.44 TRINITY_DN11608_c0_g1_i3:163-885(-)